VNDVGRVIEKVTHGWTGRGWNRRRPCQPRQPFTLQIRNVLNKVRKPNQAAVKASLHRIMSAPRPCPGRAPLPAASPKRYSPGLVEGPTASPPPRSQRTVELSDPFGTAGRLPHSAAHPSGGAGALAPAVRV
jgi:hypothetical protein